MNPIALLGNALRWVGGLLAPMFIRPTLSPGLLWTLHFILIAGIATGLYFVQKHFELMKSIEGPLWLRPFWLSILFLLVYFLAWQAWWIWKLLQPGDSVSSFPDIDEAWSGINEALGKAGVGIGDTPVYVVLGQPASGEAAMFSALPRGLTINGAPSSAAPIRVYASREAIYLTCPGASLLGIQEAGGDGGYEMADSFSQQSMAMDKSIGMDRSIGMSQADGGGTIAQVQRIIRDAREQGRPLSEAEKQQVRQLSASSGYGGQAPAKARSGGSVLQDARQVELTSARTAYFCSLVNRARYPLCPINGAIAVVSIVSAEKDEVAQQTGLVAQRDLANLIDGFKLRFPVYTLVADLESLPGGDEFIRKFAADRRQQRLGKSFPLNPDLKPTAAPDAVESGVNWIFQSLLPYWVFKLFRLETPNVESPSEAADANGKLFQFLTGVKDRSEKIARLVGRAMVPRVDDVPSYGGCYLTANDTSGSAEPLFVAEFFKKVESTQGFVSWTDEAFIADAGYRGKAKLGYTALAVIAAAVVGLAVYVLGIRNV